MTGSRRTETGHGVSRRAVLGGSLALAAGLPTATAAGGTVTSSPSKYQRANLSHLDYLGDEVTPPATPNHSTYGSGPLGVLWTYADRRADGTYARIGGGPYDAATDTYAQGAFNADDLARAAVVYLRHYRAHRDAHSRSAAYGLLRGLTYLQTTSGANAGNVVLWMQPDGTLNPSAEPVELPDPSDSGPSYWLARTVWALGEGYETFERVDPAFARFLRTRMELALDALDRQVLVKYGTWNIVDGRRVPAWLIVAGADATAEAVLGLSAYVRAGAGAARARRSLARFAEAIAAMDAGGIREWPFRALLPWGESISNWHAWGAQMPSALAEASTTLHNPRLLTPAIGDTAGFTPLLLTAGGPDNGWLPAPIDRTQIAYGVDARLQGLLGVASAGNRPGLRQVAAFVAAWYFGANHAGEPAYDVATAARTTASPATASSTATPAPSPPSTDCSRCSRWTRIPLSPARPKHWRPLGCRLLPLAPLPARLRVDESSQACRWSRPSPPNSPPEPRSSPHHRPGPANPNGATAPTSPSPPAPEPSGPFHRPPKGASCSRSSTSSPTAQPVRAHGPPAA